MLGSFRRFSDDHDEPGRDIDTDRMNSSAIEFELELDWSGERVDRAVMNGCDFARVGND